MLGARQQTVGSADAVEAAAETAGEATGSEALDVGGVLQDAAEGLFNGVRIQGIPVKGNESPGEVDCLGDTGSTLEIFLAEAGDEIADLARERTPKVWKAAREDGVFAFERGVAQPVI